MSLLPTERLFDLRNKIHQNIPQVNANKIQCERLCQRIDQLIDPLERLEHGTSTILRSETRPILDQLLECVDDCNNYIEKLASNDEWYDEIHDEKKIEEFNKRLSQIGQDLCLGLNIQEVFNRKQDQEDQKEDFKELKKKFDEIHQKISEQSQFLDKHFQHFTHNSSLQSDKTNLQPFLHIPLKDLSIDDQQPLGIGGFANVYKATWLTHHDQVAIKRLRLTHLSSNFHEDFYREISMMYRIRYEHILTVLGACIEPNFYAIVVEYMPLGSLADVLYKKHDEKIIFNWSDRYSIAWQMSKSINYLHNLNPVILHRDIKSMNFLLKFNNLPNHKYLVKVCDFGLAEIRHETFLQSASFPSIDIVGSFYWKAPELFTGHNRHTKQSDVYSLGMVLWELATNRKPWDEYDDESVILIQVKTGQRPTIPVDIPEQYKQLIEDAWNHDPEKRPTCFQLMERIYKEFDLINQLPTIVDEKHVIDLHPEQQYSSETSTTYTNSTRTGIEVNEEPNDSDSLPKTIMSESTQSEEPTVDKTEIKRNKHKSIIQSVSSCSSLEEIESNTQTSPVLQRTLSKSNEDISSTSKTENNTNTNPFPLYRIEKRRPLHNKSRWTDKKT